jgi:hypothetical protein
MTATTEQNYCKYKMQDQKKETNAIKKYYLLQHHNKATATKTEQKANARKQHQKKD